MSGYVCPHCSTCTNVFSSGGGRALAEHAKASHYTWIPFNNIPTSWSFYCLQVPFLGCVPLEPQLALAAETGSSFVDQFADSQVNFCTMVHAKQISFDIETCYLTGCTELSSNIPGPSEWHWNCGGCSDGAMSFYEKNEWKIYLGWAFKKRIELYCSCNQEKSQGWCYQCALMCGPGSSITRDVRFQNKGDWILLRALHLWVLKCEWAPQAWSFGSHQLAALDCTPHSAWIALVVLAQWP